MKRRPSRRSPHRRRRSRGAAMAETAISLPFIMVIIALLIYFGWNFRRMAQVTNMDRYVVWKQVTPGSRGPTRQGLVQDMRNPQLNNAFYDANSDFATSLTEWSQNNGYLPQGHQELLDTLDDESFSYYDTFLKSSPRGIHDRFVARHEPISPIFVHFGMGNTTQNAQGHHRLNGDWRYVNGVRYDRGLGVWMPAHSRVSPGSALRESFFADFDDALKPYAHTGNRLAAAIREFYLSYPRYVGPYLSNGVE